MNYWLRCVCCKYCGVTNDELILLPNQGRWGDKYRVMFTVQDFSSLPGFLSINTESDLFPRIFPACLCHLSINTVIFIHQGFPSLPLLLEYQHRVRFTLQDFSSITLLPEHQYRVIFTVKDFFRLPLFSEYQYRVIFTLQDFFSLLLLPECQYRVIFILQDFSTI